MKQFESPIIDCEAPLPVAAVIDHGDPHHPPKYHRMYYAQHPAPQPKQQPSMTQAQQHTSSLIRAPRASSFIKSVFNAPLQVS